MIAQPTAAAGVLRGLIEFAVSKGADRTELVARAGIAPAALDDQDNRIPLENYRALMKACQSLCGDPALALHYGEAVNLAEVSIVGLLGNASETMLHAFAQIKRYGRLVIEVDCGGIDRFELVRRGGALWLVDHRTNPNEYPEMTESTFAFMLCGTRQFGSTPFAHEVHVTHAEPAYRDEYDRIFRAPTVFSSGWNAMRIDEGWLTHRVALQPRYVFGILSDHADALLADLQASATTRGRVEALLMPVLHTGEVGIVGVAKALGVSRSSLYRALKAEGVSYECVLDELRHKLALHYLSGKKVSVNETAYLVGFSDPAAFSRAFKRWTGRSPREAKMPKVAGAAAEGSLA